MALTKSSVLHYWSSRYGLNPRVGGRPVFTRNSAGLFTTQEGEVDTAIVNTPRFDWATLNLPSGLTERRKVLSLELASTNIIDLDLASWALTNVTPTTGQADPAGGTLAQLLNSTGAGGACSRTITYTSGTKGFSLRLKAGSAANSLFGIYSNNLVDWRGAVGIAWSGGVPTLSLLGGSATLFPVRALGGGWYEIQVAIPGVVGSDTNITRLYPGGGGGTGSVYSYRPQVEALPFCTSVINGFGASRAADSCYWNFPPVPQAMMIYSRHVERADLSIDSRVWHIGASGDSNPRLGLGWSGGNLRRIRWQNAAGTEVTSDPGETTSPGDTIELVVPIQSDGKVQIIQAKNGGAVSDGALSAALALPSAWGDTKLWLNGVGASAVGAGGFAELKVVKYADVVASTAQGIMDEVRAFELGPNGDVL